MSSDKIEKTGHIRWYREVKGTNRVGNETRREREREREKERERERVHELPDVILCAGNVVW